MEPFLTDLKLSYFVAKKMITKGNKSTSLLLVCILSLAFLNLLFIKGFLSGFSDGVLESVIRSSTSHIIISPKETPVLKKYIVNENTIHKEIETIPGVLAITSHYIQNGEIRYDKEKNGSFRTLSVPIIGIDPKEEKSVMNIHENIVDGTFPDDLKDDEVILGSNVSGGYDSFMPLDLGGVRAGEKIRITYTNGIDKLYTVRGIFRITLGYSSNNVYISKKEIEKVFEVHDQASEILVRLDLQRNTIEQYLDRFQASYPTLRVEDYRKRLSSVGVLVDAFNVIAFVVTIISVIVCFATIFVMIYINATSKQKQIGILKAIGISERIISFSYIFQSFFYASVSTFIGILFLFFATIPLLSLHPILMPYGNAYLVVTTKDIVLTTILMLSSSIIAGFIPARLVSHREILKIIRG